MSGVGMERETVMRWISAVMTGLCLALTPLAAEAELVVYAPGSMNDAMEEVSAAAAKAGLAFKLVIGHSPAQARQIADGAPCDVFISADDQWTDFLAGKGLLASGGVAPLVSTHLVLIAPAGGSWSFAGQPGESLAQNLGEGRLALADPEMVPAGRFAKEALQRQGSWAGVADHLALAQNVRGVAALVERGEAPAGIAFASDVTGSGKLRVVYDFPASQAPAVQFPLAVIAGHQNDEVARLVAFLRGPQALGLLRAHGFSDPVQ